MSRRQICLTCRKQKVLFRSLWIKRSFCGGLFYSPHCAPQHQRLPQTLLKMKHTLFMFPRSHFETKQSASPRCSSLRQPTPCSSSHHHRDRIQLPREIRSEQFLQLVNTPEGRKLHEGSNERPPIKSLHEQRRLCTEARTAPTFWGESFSSASATSSTE